jgi:hypothetical protein
MKPTFRVAKACDPSGRQHATNSGSDTGRIRRAHSRSPLIHELSQLVDALRHHLAQLSTAHRRASRLQQPAGDEPRAIPARPGVGWPRERPMSIPTFVLVSSKPYAAVVVVKKNAALLEQLRRVDARARLVCEKAGTSVSAHVL